MSLTASCAQQLLTLSASPLKHIFPHCSTRSGKYFPIALHASAPHASALRASAHLANGHPEKVMESKEALAFVGVLGGGAATTGQRHHETRGCQRIRVCPLRTPQFPYKFSATANRGFYSVGSHFEYRIPNTPLSGVPTPPHHLKAALTVGHGLNSYENGPLFIRL